MFCCLVMSDKGRSVLSAAALSVAFFVACDSI